MSRCDNRQRPLMVERAKAPYGIAPVSGHIDDHGSPEEAARAEVLEEVGMIVTQIRSHGGGWRDNACSRESGPRGVGHHWSIFFAQVANSVGTLELDEIVSIRWYEPDEVQRLARRTADSIALSLVEASS